MTVDIPPGTAAGADRRRIAWVTYHRFGVTAMRAAAAAGADPTTIITFADPQRKKLAGAGEIASVAADLGAELHEVSDINGEDGIGALQDAGPDIVFVVGWPQLVQEPALSAGRLGTYGMHPSLLPRHRGRAAIPWTILNDLAITGVTLFRIDSPRADAGPIVGQQTVTLDPEDDAGTLFDKIDRAHGELVARHIDAVLGGSPALQPQDEALATFWPKRTPRDGMLDWNMTSVAVDRWVRAHTRPYPGARTRCDGAEVTVWRVNPIERERHPSDGGPPGTIIGLSEGDPLVQCGSGSVVLTDFECLEPVRSPEICDLLRSIGTLLP